MSRPLRTLLVVVGLAAAVALLFSVVFPWFDATFVDDPVLGSRVPSPSHAG